MKINICEELFGTLGLRERATVVFGGSKIVTNLMLASF